MGDRVRWEPALDINRIVAGAQVVAVVALLTARSIVKARLRAAEPQRSGLPAVPLVAGTGYGALYLAFAVAVLAAVAGFVRGQIGAVFATLVALLSLPVLGLVPALKPWLPSELLTAVVAMAGGAPATEYVRSAAAAVAATAGLLALAVHRFGLREL